MADRLMVPPIRTALANNPDGSPLISTSPNGGPISTERQWWFYWRDIGDAINAGSDKLNNLVTYGTHANRPAPADMPDGALYMETDRGSVIYQNQFGVWLYLAGTMWGTLVPDQRPTDLGVHDAGFDFRTTVAPAREFVWNQIAWVETTAQINTVQIVYATAIMSLSTSPTPVPGVSLTLAAAGKYLINGIFDFLISGDPAALLVGTVTGGGGHNAVAYSTADGRFTVAQQWIITATAGQVEQMFASKTAGTGASSIYTNSSLAALWVSP